MKVKITMIDNITYTLTNPEYNTLSEFIENQLIGTYYTIDTKNGIAIRTSNILIIKHLDIKPSETKK